MHRYLPVLALVLLAVAIPEILFGSTPLSQPGRILVTMPIYAGGAVLIRELARRRRIGWTGIAMLGVAYGIVEEGLALGSIFNPSMFNAGLVGGRLFGVNWTWTEWTLGYHAVWSITIPILLTELVFPSHRAEPWLGKIGLAVAGLVYLAGAVFLALIFRLVVAPDFTPPAVQLTNAGLVAIALAALALRRPVARRTTDSSIETGTPSPWLVGLLALVVAAAWFELLLLPAPIKGSGWVVVPMALVLGLLAGLVLAIRKWSTSGHGWTDLHRLALAVGPLPVSLWYGLTYVTASSPIDRAGEAAAGLVAAGLLLLLGRRLRGRAAATGASGPPTAPGALAASVS